MVLVLVIIAGITVATVVTLTLVPKLFAELSSPSLTPTATTENDVITLIQSTKALPEVKQFLQFYPNATAQADDTYTIAKEQQGVRYSFDKKYFDRNFTQTANLYIVLNDKSGLSGGKSYSVHMTCVGTSYFDMERGIDSHAMIASVDSSNVTKFVNETECAK
jgi:hypothetical protein